MQLGKSLGGCHYFLVHMILKGGGVGMLYHNQRGVCAISGRGLEICSAILKMSRRRGRGGGGGH